MAEKRSLEEIQAEIDSGPKVGAAVDSTAPRPIGVPQYTRDPDTGKTIPFTAARPAMPTRGDYESGHDYVTAQVPPRYWDGDEWRPASWDAQRIADVQAGLAKAGLLDAKSITLGVWDTASKDAYKKILGTANAMGVPWETALEASVAAPQITEPLQVKLTDPADLRRVFRAAAFDVSATQFTPAQIDAMVASYHERERKAQESEARGDETVIAPMDPSTFAMDQAETVNPAGVHERRLGNAENAWLAAIQEGGATGA